MYKRGEVLRDSVIQERAKEGSVLFVFCRDDFEARPQSVFSESIISSGIATGAGALFL